MSMAPQTLSQTIFITGGTGFVGREIVRTLRETHADWRLISYDLNLPLGNEKQPDVEYIQGDILDSQKLGSVLTSTSPTAVIHTAGIVTPLTKRYNKELRPLIYKVNVEGTKSVLAAAQATPTVKAFIWTGSCCAVIDDFRYQYPNIDETWLGTPTQENTIYGESKALAEAIVLAANKPNGSKPFLTCSLRPSTLFGDSDSQLISGIHALIASGETPYVIGNGLNLWDVCHANNVADAHLLAAENLLLGDKKAAGEAFFIGNEEPIPFRTFCLAVWREFGHVPKFEVPVPMNLAWVLGYLTEWVSFFVGRNPALRRESVADATATRYADGKKAREILGYKARLSLHDGIARSCRLQQQREAERAALMAVKTA